MASLYHILDETQAYLDRCESCAAGRAGTCAWLRQFGVAEGGVVCEGTTHYERAKGLHRKTGAPPCEQRTFRQFHMAVLRLIGKVRCEKQMPESVPEMRDFLMRVMQTIHGLDELSDGMRGAFEEPVMCAMELAVGALDFYCLETLKRDYLELFLSYAPKYDREAALREFSFDAEYVEACLREAQKVRFALEQVVSTASRSQEGEVQVATGTLAGLDKTLVSERAMSVWKEAQVRGWVDAEYRWKLSKQEKAMFVGRFSQYLFYDKRAHWQPFKQWDGNCNYAKDYNAVKDQVLVGEANENVTVISAYFDGIDKAHALV